MKRSGARVILTLFCLLIFSGCAPGASAPGTSAPAPASSPSPTGAGGRDAIPFGADQRYAVAYLGYQRIDDLDYYVERYLDSGRLPACFISEGDFYLVIPRYAGMTLSLFVNDPETSEGRLCFEDPDCEPFILQCNASDIFADATVRLTLDGDSVEFSPFISLKDGSLDAGEYGLDITKPGTLA